MHVIVKLIVAITTLGIAWFYNYYFSKAAKTKRSVNKVKERLIQDFQNGTIGRITGKAIDIGESMISPVSGRKGLYHRLGVVETSGKYSTLFFEKQLNKRIVLQDSSGYAVVYLDKAEEVYSSEMDYFPSASAIPPANPAQFLRDNHIVDTDHFGNKKQLTIREFEVTEGMQLSVVGHGEWESTSSLGLNLPVSSLLVLRSVAHQAVLVRNY